MTLPTEILLQILHCLPLEVLLDFRLISSWADALVLEPVFWHRLEFSKHLLFKSGSAHRRTSFGLDRVVAPGEGALGGTGTGASAGAVVESRHRDSVFQHFSDANLITRRHTLAASLLSPTSEANGEEASPSMTISANIPRPLGSRQPALLHQLQQQQQQQQQQGDGLSTSLNVFSSTLPKTSAWTRIENSFLLFLNRLASIDRTAQGVRTVTIEDWEGVGSVQALWASLGCFLGLRSLTIRNSALRHLTAFYNRDDGDHVHGGGGGGGGGPIWAELKELALQDCLQLRSLSGIQTWLPQLQDLSLAECTSLEDFTPLVQPTSSPSSSGPKSGTREILALKRVSLIHTKIRDEELIALLRRSPGLEELRLDQCYELTVRALEAIAFGDKTPTTHAAGTAATEAAAQPGIDVTIQEAGHTARSSDCYPSRTAPISRMKGSGPWSDVDTWSGWSFAGSARSMRIPQNGFIPKECHSGSCLAHSVGGAIGKFDGWAK
ncbi:hypothetical protein BGX33_012240 [Mortierella sp. NVP41]|nr:hypothetical protein BGX33_012240 [Mortierella sp. NVP41]